MVRQNPDTEKATMKDVAHWFQFRASSRRMAVALAAYLLRHGHTDVTVDVRDGREFVLHRKRISATLQERIRGFVDGLREADYDVD